MESILKASGQFQTQGEFAKSIGVSQCAVSKWMRGVLNPSAKHALKIERLTGVSRHEIRPDIFGAA